MFCQTFVIVPEKLITISFSLHLNKSTYPNILDFEFLIVATHKIKGLRDSCRNVADFPGLVNLHVFVGIYNSLKSQNL